MKEALFKKDKAVLEQKVEMLEFQVKECKERFEIFIFMNLCGTRDQKKSGRRIIRR